ncbi:hypothetical protein LX15_003007 [Streptoalloteichus tenebrarius]|uniref:WXG100 family type VII secretion target n=1 Tax=Streptoalloteichus tenebrarius (strain ATCC 17920 / DSM 40477 / JCM 4838 / CBS 697.72 / NBRC 16177 / NCIMB 11028 / NRRL B-12390 / A12253. 1 / ISP 5477) TaxID=1933 RepID=A0ABT1HUW2_STRSD|nr:hypothetical protein [Streptoalloteichus tenebrarius]MCP2259306.1 hypothetical protein [Streptoalloteichus tenebrarius]BFE99069.1 hypothetical protein GCM10020241_07450 [Streptoalloteichus tenebrarius]
MSEIKVDFTRLAGAAEHLAAKARALEACQGRLEDSLKPLASIWLESGSESAQALFRSKDELAGAVRSTVLTLHRFSDTVQQAVARQHREEQLRAANFGLR